MKKIYADRTRIFLDNWNSAYGNKILHLLFLINICSKHGREPVMYRGSNLDDIFDFKMTLLDNNGPHPLPEYIYEEKSPFCKSGRIYSLLGLKNRVTEKDLTTVLLRSFLKYLEQRHLLERGDLPDKDLMIKGHFFEYELMPTLHTFKEYLSPKEQLVGFILKKYQSLTNRQSVSVHLRGTDFTRHLRNTFIEGIPLDDQYYHEAILAIEKIKGKDIEYHLFSDDMPRLENIFKGKNYIIHDDNAPLDWVALFLSNNIIQSNSAFCWTASLYNKDTSIQPICGYNYFNGIGSIPFSFAHKGSILIDPKRTITQVFHEYSEGARFNRAGWVEGMSKVTGPIIASLARFIKRTLRK